MRCRDCGRLNPNVNKYCVHCGAALGFTFVEESDAIRYDPVAAREFLKKAEALADEGNLQSAIEQCHRAIAADPLFPSAHNYLGTLYGRAGEHDRAVQEYESAMDLLSLRAKETPTPSPNGGRRASRVAITAGFIGASTALVMLFVHLIATAGQAPDGAPMEAQTAPLTAPQFGPLSGLLPDPAPQTESDPADAGPRVDTPPPPMGAAGTPSTGARPSAQPSPSEPQPRGGDPALSQPRPVGPARLDHDGARQLMHTGEWAAALQVLDILIADQAPTGAVSPDLHFDRARCLEELDRNDAARLEYETARRGYDGWVAAGVNLEQARQGIANCDRALERLDATP